MYELSAVLVQAITSVLDNFISIPVTVVIAAVSRYNFSSFKIIAVVYISD